MADADTHMQSPGILIVEDDVVVANGLREMLRADGYRVVAIAEAADQVARLVRAHQPALAVLDIDLGASLDGIDLARDVFAPSGVRILFASAHTEETTLARARAVGAGGFIVKPFTRKQLRAAVEIALAGPPSRPQLLQSIGAHIASANRALAQLSQVVAASTVATEAAADEAPSAPLDALTEREREVVRGLLDHRRVPSIAETLGISAHTVRNHLKAIFAKLGVRSQQELLDRLVQRPGGSSRPRGR